MQISKKQLVSEDAIKRLDVIMKRYYPDYELVDGTIEEVQKVENDLELRSHTPLDADEIVEFFSKEEYILFLSESVKCAKSHTNRGDKLFAIATRYFLVDGKRVGEHRSFIDIGGMVRTHFDVSGCNMDENGKIYGARRRIIPYSLNQELASFDSPWDMLTKFLAGKKVKATRSTDKLFFQRIQNQQPIPDEYREQRYLIYNFYVDINKQTAILSNNKMVYRYDVITRKLLTYEGNSLIKAEGIDEVRRRNWPGANICDWEVVVRMAKQNNQQEVQVESHGEIIETNSVDKLESSIKTVQSWLRSIGFPGPSRLEKESKDDDKLSKTALTGKSLINAVIAPNDVAVCYVHSKTFDIDDGLTYYEGYAIVSLEVKEVYSHKYLVLIYDKQQDNNGFSGVDYGIPAPNYSNKCMSYNSICYGIKKLECENYPIVMREKNSNTLEPIFKSFGNVSCYYLQCKEKLDYHG